MSMKIKVLSVVVLTLLTGVIATSICYSLGNMRQNDVVKKPVVVLPVTPQILLDEVNKQRALHSLKPLTLDTRLNSSATAKLADMMEFQYFEHENPISGKHGYDWINDTGIKCKPGTPAENIQESSDHITGTAYDIISNPEYGFMSSQSHRAAILNSDIDATGFAVQNGMTVQHFCDYSE